MTLPFAKLHALQGIVYAFEPDFENISQLRINLKINGLNNVVLVPVALQDDPLINEISFYRRRTVDGDGLINRGLSTILQMPTHNIGEEKVATSTIDRYVEEHHIPKVHFIKIDVEGAEFKVLKGGEQTIRKHLPIILYEYSTIIDELTNSQNSLQSFQFMKTIGYRQYQIVQEKYLLELNEYNPAISSSNIICFHASQIPLSLSQWLKSD